MLYTKDQLKEYIHNHYNSSEQPGSAITEARKDLRIIINNAYDKSENDASGYDLVKQR